jgi:hypothetical protein
VPLVQLPLQHCACPQHDSAGWALHPGEHTLPPQFSPHPQLPQFAVRDVPQLSVPVKLLQFFP